jgi:ATP-dependent 26S proteasome regulatory subunit
MRPPKSATQHDQTLVSDSLQQDSDSEDNEELIMLTQKSYRGRKRGPKSKTGTAKKTNYKKVKSLGNFCQQFIKLFVSWKSVISLEEAALKISDNEHLDEKMLKTKIRRLYDIANVLSSIGLISKTQMVECRKPAFKWIGLHGTKASIQEIKELVEATRNELSSIKKNGGQQDSKALQLTLTKTLS